MLGAHPGCNSPPTTDADYSLKARVRPSHLIRASGDNSRMVGKPLPYRIMEERLPVTRAQSHEMIEPITITVCRLIGTWPTITSDFSVRMGQTVV